MAELAPRPRRPGRCSSAAATSAPSGSVPATLGALLGAGERAQPPAEMGPATEAVTREEASALRPFKGSLATDPSRPVVPPPALWEQRLFGPEGDLVTRSRRCSQLFAPRPALGARPLVIAYTNSPTCSHRTTARTMSTAR
jgi:hypothetical protein